MVFTQTILHVCRAVLCEAMIKGQPFFPIRAFYIRRKRIRKTLCVSILLQGPMVWRMHHLWLFNKACLVCCWNKIWKWTVGILPNYMWENMLFTVWNGNKVIKDSSVCISVLCLWLATDKWIKNLVTGANYQLNTQSVLTWSQAETSCRQQGAFLLSVSDPNQQAFVSGKIPPGECVLAEHKNKRKN